MSTELPTLDAIDLEIFYRKHEAGHGVTGICSEKFMYGATRISIVPKLRPIFECKTNDKWSDIEFFLLRGGRGGAKSESVGEKLVLLAREETTRILCTREIQNTISDSVMQVIVEWVDKLGFRSEFHITDKKIIHKKTGTDFIFMGLKTGTDTDSVKSLKGVKYCWIEEAQTLSKESWKMLKPTLRIDGRVFFLSYNPRTEHDVVDTIRKLRKAHLIHINYYDNPFLPSTTHEEALEDKELDNDEYLHVWEGKAKVDDASSIVLPYSELLQCVDLHKTHGFGEGRGFAGFDIADGQHDHHDRNSFAFRQAATVHAVEEWQIGQVYESVRKVHGWYYDYGFEEVNFDAIGVGVAAKSEYARLEAEEANKENGFRIPYDVNPYQGSMAPLGPDAVFIKHSKNVIINKQYLKNLKAQIWWNMRLRLKNSMKLIQGHKIDREGYFLSFSSKIKNIDKLLSELSQATYKLDGAGRIMIDKAPGDRVIKVDGKSKIIKSPNQADSVGLSYANDLEYGLRAHGDEAKPEVFIPETAKQLWNVTMKRNTVLDKTDHNKKLVKHSIWCPGCKMSHFFNPDDFDGDYDFPTVDKPIHNAINNTVLNLTSGRFGHKCRAHITAGVIRFSPDSSHKLRGTSKLLGAF